MPNTALKAGINWKEGVIGANLAAAQQQLNIDAANPTEHFRIPADVSLIARYADEWMTLHGNDKGKAWDLVKNNLERRIESTTKDLAGWNGSQAHRDHIFPDTVAAALEAEIKKLTEMLNDLKKEGRPS